MDDVTYIDADTIFSTLGPADAADALAEALATDFDPENDIPRTIDDVTAGNVIFMPAEIGDSVGVKLVGVAPANAELGLPRIIAQYLMYDAATLELTTILEGAALTTLRTPAVSIAAVRPALARFTADVNVVVFGAGPQGLGHVDALRAVLDVDLADVAFVVRHPEKVGDEVTVRGRVLTSGSAEVDVALSEADVVIAATTASQPLFDAGLIRTGAVVMACGAHEPDHRELPADLLRDATVVVESRTSALREAGDVVMAIADGAITADDLVTMKEIATGAVTADADRTLVFKGSGMSWEDLAVAMKVVATLG